MKTKIINFTGRQFTCFIITVLIILITTNVIAFGIPKSDKLTFDIVRNGEKIGTHIYHFKKIGTVTEVRIKTDIAYKLLFITLYRFQHQSLEVWKNKRLTLLESITNDNGNSVKLRVYLAKNSLIVKTKDGKQHVEREIIPASLWNLQLVAQHKTLATVSGKVKKFRAKYVGDELLKAGDRNRNTRHFRLIGEFQRDLWYDENNVLVSARLEADDGSTVEYILK